ncbi:hypothetical protein, partial [Mangrovimonas sp. TPBH4]|uniref:hypothetical protein n=1 Tax=Mangrovimonas sp. TPBH4 TaxID=1645914 RepID=UPI001E41A35E
EKLSPLAPMVLHPWESRSSPFLPARRQVCKPPALFCWGLFVLYTLPKQYPSNNTKPLLFKLGFGIQLFCCFKSGFKALLEALI